MHFDSSYFIALLFSAKFLGAVWLVVWVTVLAMLIGIVVGTIGGIVLTSPAPALHPIFKGYVTFLRGIPVLVQIVFWYNGLTALTGGAVNLPALWAGVLALGINEGAYMTEVVRSGINAVDRGQREASQALGLHYFTMMRKVILPQAVRIAIVPTGNQVINLIKNTSLLFTIAIPEIFGTATNIYSANFRYFEVIAVAAIWYTVLAVTYTLLQRLLERHFSKGNRGLYA